MTTKMFKHGKYNCKAYKKAVGKGFEVGLTLGGHEIFVGNFIHGKEAGEWWKIMTAEMHKFSKRYGPSPNAPMALYTKFLSNSMYKAYYGYVDRAIGKHSRGLNQLVRMDERRFANFRKNANPTPHQYTPARRAA